MKKPTKEQLKKGCVICVKLMTGDYHGAVIDLSHDAGFFDKLMRMPWIRGSSTS